MLKRLAPPSSYTAPQRVRYYVYTYAIIIGVPLMALTWYFVRQEDVFARIVYPLLGAYCIYTLIGLVKAKQPLKHSERRTFVVVAVIWITRAIHSLFVAPTEQLMEATHAIYFSYVLLALLAYLMFSNITALKLSIFTLFTSIVIGVAQLVFQAADFAAVLQFNAYLAVTLGCIYALSYFKTALTETKAKAELLEVMAFKDSLTGLSNRRYVYNSLQEHIALADRYRRPLSIILIDIDHFKQINDRYGHDIGDLVLKQFAELINPLLREGDIWGRWGGEEFLIVCPETPLENAALVAERLCQSIERHSFPSASKVSASFGLSDYQQNLNIEALLKQADEMLYEAKRSGRNQVSYLKQESVLS